MYIQIEKELLVLKNSEKAKILQGFFKTGKWTYGEWDIFLWITVPQQRQIVKKYFKEVDLDEIQKLLKSKYHEFRMVWLLCLVYKYENFKIEKNQKEIFNFYINNLKYVNSWDLVDLTCPKIVGDYLLDKNKDMLYYFAKDKNMWIQRISIVSTMTFIKKWLFEDTIKIAEILLNHKHDLIHKAVWWMLREVGKKDLEILETFLDKHYNKMPRTMLRYSTEKFDEKKRKYYLMKK